MHLKFCAIGLCLLSVLARAQNPRTGSTSTQTPIKGIKIVSSSFDPLTSPQKVQLDFINDSASNITAWGFCVKAEKTRDNDPSQGFCRLIDVMPVVVDREVQERITREENPADCPDCHFVHPGEQKILSYSFGFPVRSAKIEINLIAYSNGKVEISGPEGSPQLKAIISYRQQDLRQAQHLIDIGKKILTDSTNPHPAVSMIDELQNRGKSEPFFADQLDDFKKPERRKGNYKEFLPEDEHGYLSKFVLEQEMKAVEFAKYLIPEVSQ